MEEDRRDWHLEKGVSLTHIISTVTMFLMIVSAYATMSERLAVLENQQAGFNQRIIEILGGQRITDVRQDAEIAETKKLIREDLREINHKLDALRR
jgi:hypothetical protein